MLITTSRKPSPRTRTFSKSLERILNSKYINRGKMSMRDVLVKSKTSGLSSTVVISEMKGNPSKMDFYGPEGDLISSFDITTSNSIISGRIKKKNLCINWQLPELKDDLREKINSLIEIPECEVEPIVNNSKNSYLNLLLIKEGEKGSKAVAEFYDQEGQLTGPRIFIHSCRFGEVDGSFRG